MKQCSQCEEFKLEIKFHIRSDNGRMTSECKECRKKYKNKHYNSVKCLPRQRYKHLLNGAITRNIEISLSLEQYLNILKPNCHYCQEDFSKEVGGGLDRIDNNQGYHEYNVVPCCGKCNFGKSDRFTSEEWKIMIDALKRWQSVRESNP